jgi:hypothetical protein
VAGISIRENLEMMLMLLHVLRGEIVRLRGAAQQKAVELQPDLSTIKRLASA